MCYRHHRRHGRHEQRKRELALHICYCYSGPAEPAAQTLERSTPAVFMASGGLVPGLCQNCLDYGPGQPIHQPQRGLIIFYAFRVIFTSPVLLLSRTTHPQGRTNKPKVPRQHKGPCNQLMITSSRSSLPIVSRPVR